MKTRWASLITLLLLSSAVYEAGEENANLNRQETINYIQSRLGEAFSCDAPDRTLVFECSAGSCTIRSKKQSGQRYRSFEFEVGDLDPSQVEVQPGNNGVFSVTLYAGPNSQGFRQIKDNGSGKRIAKGAIACFRDRTVATGFGNAMAHLMELNGAPSTNPDPFQ